MVRTFSLAAVMATAALAVATQATTQQTTPQAPKPTIKHEPARAINSLEGKDTFAAYCATCHGQDAKGTAIAPNLTDSEWLNGDGSLAFIEHTVTTGVPKPKSHPAPMPPMGGASLNPDQIKAVAAYVYSLSHKS